MSDLEATMVWPMPAENTPEYPPADESTLDELVSRIDGTTPDTLRESFQQIPESQRLAVWMAWDETINSKGQGFVVNHDTQWRNLRSVATVDEDVCLGAEDGLTAEGAPARLKRKLMPDFVSDPPKRQRCGPSMETYYKSIDQSFEPSSFHSEDESKEKIKKPRSDPVQAEVGGDWFGCRVEACDATAITLPLDAGNGVPGFETI